MFGKFEVAIEYHMIFNSNFKLSKHKFILRKTQTLKNNQTTLPTINLF